MPKKRKYTRITAVEVEAEPRDEVDHDRFAWALLQYCRLKIEAEEKGAGEP